MALMTGFDREGRHAQSSYHAYTRAHCDADGDQCRTRTVGAPDSTDAAYGARLLRDPAAGATSTRVRSTRARTTATTTPISSPPTATFAPEQGGKIGDEISGARAAGRSVRRRIARLQERRLDQAGREAHVRESHHHRVARRRDGHGGHADDWPQRRPYKIRHEGYYEDTYVRTPQGWRFKSRIHHVPMTTPPAEAGAASRRSRVLRAEASPSVLAP